MIVSYLKLPPTTYEEAPEQLTGEQKIRPD